MRRRVDVVLSRRSCCRLCVSAYPEDVCVGVLHRLMLCFTWRYGSLSLGSINVTSPCSGNMSSLVPVMCQGV